MNKQILEGAFPFWEKLLNSEKEIIVNNSVEVVYNKGEIVHRSDVKCKGSILVTSGTLRVYIISEEGREVTLFRIHEGESCVLSASCLLDTITFDIFIEATETVKAIVIPTNVLHQVMEQNPYMGLYMYKTASERFSDVMWTMQQILFMGIDRRVAIYLCDELIRQKGNTIKVTHEEIAKNIGSAREVVTKVMNYFSEEGIVKLSRGKVEIIDKASLIDYL